jgi:hypothetical protein
MINRVHMVLIAATLCSVAALSPRTALAARADSFSILSGDSTFTDAGIIVNPFSGNGSAGLFGVSANCCMGVQGGSNNAAVDDLDGLQGGTDSERWEFDLDAGNGLTSLEFIYTRATVVLSGFLTDPQAAVNVATVVPVYDNGTLTFNHGWRGGAITDLTFGNPGASSGQTIALSVFDTAQAAPQAAVYAFEWDLAAPTFPGDVDGDGDVDLVEANNDMLSDFDIIRSNWFNSSSPTRAMGDLNGDGVVEFDDFAQWKEAFPFPIAGSFEAGFYVVPEPTGMALLSATILGLGSRMIRSKRGPDSFSRKAIVTKQGPEGNESRPLFLMLGSLAMVVVLTAPAAAQLSVGFENPPYIQGTLQNQQGWTGGANFPRVQTESQIASELVAAGLNAGTTVHSGSQALLVTYNPGETEGGLVGKPFTGLESESQVAMDLWARPLTAGTMGSTIGFELGNTFVGLRDAAGVRAAAARFGVVRDETNQITGTTIDYASATAGPTTWVPSGLTWAADTWYNFRFELNYVTKEYDFFIDDTKVNASPIQFYNTSSVAATNVFVSRGPNNAGQIIDDINIDHDFTKKLLLSIDSSNGNAVVMNNTGAAVSLDSYTIASTSNSLLTGWGSLADQSMSGWVEAVPSTGRVSELNPTGTLTLNPGQSITLNGLWNTAGPQDASDFTFQYRDSASGPTQFGAVEFASAGSPGDFDNDGDVDGRDFLTWQRGGSPTPLSASDLAAWQVNYGSGGLTANVSAASVPEPSAVLLFACGFAVVGGRRLFCIMY